MWAIRLPSGPIEKGTTYMVRPRIEPRKSPVRVSRISAGAPVVVRPGVFLALQADEGPILDARHVARVERAR